MLVPKSEVNEVRQVKEERQQLDREFAGRIRNRKGLKLYAMCNKHFEVYEVKKRKVESKTAKVDFVTKEVTNKPREEYVLQKGHYILWALNMENACRKFNKFIDELWG